MIRLWSPKYEWVMAGKLLWESYYKWDPATLIPRDAYTLRVFRSVDAVLANKDTLVLVRCDANDPTVTDGCTVGLYGALLASNIFPGPLDKSPYMPWLFWDEGARKDGKLSKKQLARFHSIADIIEG